MNYGADGLGPGSGSGSGTGVPGLLDEAAKHMNSGTHRNSLAHVGLDYSFTLTKTKQKHRTLVNGQR